jgi:hypothetical protein
MRKSQWIVLLVCGAALGTPRIFAQRPEQAAALLEAATQAALVDGKLAKAIGLYQQVVTSYSANRPVAAAALLGLAQCYEVLGDPKTRQTYERLIAQYSDQAREVSIARARLANLSEELMRARDDRSEVLLREVWSRPEPSVNTDSNFVIFSDLAIHNPQTQETKRLLSGARSAAYPVLSPGMGNNINRRVAYLSWSGDLQASLSQAQGGRAGLPARVELRVVGLNGQNDRAIFSSRDVPWLRPFAWSPDGEQILTDFERRDGTHELALVSVADGTKRVLKSFGPTSPQEVSFSQDGGHIAYKLPSPRDSRRLEVFFLPLAANGSARRAERRYTLSLGPDLA